MRNLKIKILENGIGLPLPKYESSGAAGLDLMAAIKENQKILISPGKAEMIPSGIAIAIPEGFEAQIRPRSGLASKNGITVLNSPGTIDSDYRGEILIMLINHSKKNFEISGLIILIFFTVIFTSYFNYKKNLNDKTFNNFIDNIYFKKTLNHIIENFDPKYKKVKHKIRQLKL